MPAQTRRATQRSSSPESSPHSETNSAIERDIARAQERAILLQRLADARQAERQAEAALQHEVAAVAPVPTSRPQWRPQPPITYGGNNMRLLENYLYQCRNAFALDGAPTSDQQRVTWALQYLSTNIGILWQARSGTYPEDRLWENYVAYLKDQVALPQMREDEYRAKLEAARQLDGQTPQEFDQYLNTLESKLIGIPEGEEDKGNRFFYKLQEPLRIAIRANNQNNLDIRRSAIVMTASLAWANMDPSKRSRKRGTSDATQERTYRNQRKRLDRRNDSRKPAENKPTPDNADTIKCIYCKKDGHTEDKCWTKNPELRPKWSHQRNDAAKKESGKA